MSPVTGSAPPPSPLRHLLAWGRAWQQSAGGREANSEAARSLSPSLLLERLLRASAGGYKGLSGTHRLLDGPQTLISSAGGRERRRHSSSPVSPRRPSRRASLCQDAAGRGIGRFQLLLLSLALPLTIRGQTRLQDSFRQPARPEVTLWGSRHSAQELLVWIKEEICPFQPTFAWCSLSDPSGS